MQTATPSRLITRPSFNAKERVRSIYISETTYESLEAKAVVDKYGFIHNHHTVLAAQDTDIPSADDIAALQAYRARELKVSKTLDLLIPNTNARHAVGHINVNNACSDCTFFGKSEEAHQLRNPEQRPGQSLGK